MNKDKEVEVVDSREAEVDLTMEMKNLIILCNSNENLNGKVKTKARQSGNVVIPTKVETIPIDDDLNPTLEVDFMVNVIDVVVKVIDPLNVKFMVRMLVEMF